MIKPSHVEKSMSHADKKQLISDYALFCLMNANDTHELALLSREISVPEDTIIVKEGDIVDTIYLVKSGTAQVTKTVQNLEKKEVMHIAILREGDSIGLNESGFFSNSGIRNATVTALSPMILLAIDIKIFNDFLAKSSIYYPALQNTGERILLMHSLKNNKFFKQISNEKIRQIAHRATRMSINEGDVLFNEGDFADAYYFLISGKISLSTTNGNEQKIIKELEAPAFFGEAALMDNTRRNANAQALTHCELILITRVTVLEVIKHDRTFAKSLTLTRIEQIRPKPVANIAEKEQNGYKKVQLTHPNTNNTITLSSQQYEMWKAMDGYTPLIDIKNKFSGVSMDEVYTFALKLNKAHFLKLNEIPGKKPVSGFKNSIHKLMDKIKAVWK
ncbi:MAG: cyclic nucleotide-binding domain-containing protein [Legionella sp.]|nr:MAG: cyclic nucleotide-binding domain-containing protein [Legionella sp.]